MRGPPDPEMRNPAAANGRANSQNGIKSTTDNKRDALDVQAEKLRRLYCFCHATACTIASLAFAVSR